MTSPSNGSRDWGAKRNQPKFLRILHLLHNWLTAEGLKPAKEKRVTICPSRGRTKTAPQLHLINNPSPTLNFSHIKYPGTIAADYIYN